MTEVDVPRILVVDDDLSVSRALIRCLAKKCDVHCVATHDGLSAFRLLNVQTYAVLVTDMAMAGMSGVELLRIASERWPQMRRVLFTGYADAGVVADNQNYADAVLAKGSAIHPICKTICELAFNARPGENGGECAAS